MLIKLCWGSLALIHLLPALALFKPNLLTNLYGTEAGSVTYLLLHHRAALFLGVLILCVWALLKPEVRQLASIIVSISMISFVILFLYNGMPSNLRVIALVDLIGLPLLFIAIWDAFVRG